jgi:hypothetical protein
MVDYVKSILLRLQRFSKQLSDEANFVDVLIREVQAVQKPMKEFTLFGSLFLPFRSYHPQRLPSVRDGKDRIYQNTNAEQDQDVGERRRPKSYFIHKESCAIYQGIGKDRLQCQKLGFPKSDEKRVQQQVERQ